MKIAEARHCAHDWMRRVGEVETGEGVFGKRGKVRWKNGEDPLAIEEGAR